MRAMLLPVAALALVTGLGGIVAADPLQTGGVSITHCGGNTNTASGVNSFAGQSATTIEGMACGHGDGNSNRATARNSTALQDTTTFCGSAFGQGATSTVTDGQNFNRASGVGSLVG